MFHLELLTKFFNLTDLFTSRIISDGREFFLAVF